MNALQIEIRTAFRDELRALLAEQEKGLMGWAEAAKYLDISERFLWDLVKREGFSVVRHTDGGPKKLRRSELDAYIERRTERSPQ